MKQAASLFCALVACLLIGGCSSSGGGAPGDQDKALRDKLSKPPGLPGGPTHAPRGAKQPPPGQPGGGPAPGATTTGSATPPTGNG